MGLELSLSSPPSAPPQTHTTTTARQQHRIFKLKWPAPRSVFYPSSMYMNFISSLSLLHLLLVVVAVSTANRPQVHRR